MKSQKIKFIFLFAFCNLQLMVCGSLFAQKVLKDTMLHVVKQFQPTIADAYKINDRPVVKDSIPPAPNLSYSINSKKVFTPYTVEMLKPAKMVGEPLTKLYNALVKVGAGNYNTPYAEAFYNNGRSKEFSYGTHLKHFSSSANMKEYGFGGVSDNQIDLYGKKFFRKQTLAGSLDYNRNVIHYYGYDRAQIYIDNNDSIKQRYSNIGGNIALQSHYTDTTHINYLLKLKYYNLTDLYKTSENNLSASGYFSGYFEKQLFQIPLSVDYYNNKSATDTNNSVLIGLTPKMSFSGEKWRTSIGIKISMEGNYTSKSNFFFLPNIDFNYNVVENIIIPYTGVTSGLKKNSLKSLSDENPFIVPAPALGTTITKWEAYAGVKGSISKTISYNTRTSYSKLEDMYFFVNDNSDLSKKGFNTVYYNATLWNVHGELQFQQTEKIKVLAKGDYNKYTMPNDTIKPWHHPPLQLTFTANYNLKNKIILNADVFVADKRFAYLQGTGSNVNVITAKELNSIVDANLGIEYRYSKKLSGFVNFNNLGFSRYYLWNNYRSYNFNFLAGVTVIF